MTHTETECQIADTRQLQAELAAEFRAAWPEPPDGTRVEWEDSGGAPCSAVRTDGADTHDLPIRWWMHNCPGGAPYTWRELVGEMLDGDGVRSMADVVILGEVEQ